MLEKGQLLIQLNIFHEQENKLTTRYLTIVLGGKKADLGKYPWICGLYRDEKFVCGLSLLHENYGLTAAHCFTSAKRLQRK